MNNDALWEAVMDREERWAQLGRDVATAPAAPGILGGVGLTELSSCHTLQELCVVCPEMKYMYEGQPMFDTAPLAALPRLRRLALKNFSEFNLRGLPPTLRVLRAVGASMMHEMVWPALEALALPGGCSLEHAQVIYRHLDRAYDGETTEEEGFTQAALVRLPLWHVWPACRQLETDVLYVCLGPPPADDARVVQTPDVRPLLDALLLAMTGASLLRRLSADPESFLGLASGELIQAAALASPRGRAQLGAHTGGRVLSVEEGESEDVMEMLHSLDRAMRVRPRHARRMAVTSNAPSPSP